MAINESKNYTTQSYKEQQVSALMNVPTYYTKQSSNYSSNKFIPRYSDDSNHNRNNYTFTNRNTRNTPRTSTFTTTSRSYEPYQDPSRTTTQRSSYNRNNLSFTTTDNNGRSAISDISPKFKQY